MNLFHRLDGFLGVIGAMVLFGMMALTFVDVIMRYGFNASLRGAFEITELMMVILIYAGLPVVSRHSLHVTTDLIDRFLTPPVRRVFDVIGQLICAAVLFGAAWLIWVKAGKLADLGDTTAALQIKLAPFVYLMCALIFVTAVIHLIKAFNVGSAAGTEASAGAL
ncbi:MAG: TRAP transporter small permease [Burkholderiales bacterium]